MSEKVGTRVNRDGTKESIPFSQFDIGDVIETDGFCGVLVTVPVFAHSAFNVFRVRPGGRWIQVEPFEPRLLHLPIRGGPLGPVDVHAQPILLPAFLQVEMLFFQQL